MSLSDNASVCLMSIIKKLAALNVTEKEYREIIHRSLLERLRKGLKSQTEVLGLAIVTVSFNYCCLCLFSFYSCSEKQSGFVHLIEILNCVNQTFNRGVGMGKGAVISDFIQFVLQWECSAFLKKLFNGFCVLLCI